MIQRDFYLLSIVEAFFIEEFERLDKDTEAGLDGFLVKVVGGVEAGVIVAGRRGVHCGEAAGFDAALSESRRVRRAEENIGIRQVKAGFL